MSRNLVNPNLDFVSKMKSLLQNKGRSAEAMKNILLSFIGKGISVLASLLIVPLTINYVNPTQYGIWLTLSSIVLWINYLDFGLGNGYRNRFAEALAKQDYTLARELTSTTYFALSAIVLVVFFVLCIFNSCLDWTVFLKLEASYADELKSVFAVLSLFFCVNLVANLFCTLLTADQKPGIASIATASGQVVSLFVIFILTKISKGSLFKLSLFFSGAPCLVLILFSIFGFSFTSYRKFSPSIKYFKLSRVGSIMGLGVKFFVIYLCMLAVFQISNIVISRELGSIAVTQYNIAYKYFNLLYSVMLLIIQPFWSGFTDAWSLHDYDWMKRIIKKLEKCWLWSILIGIIMLILSSKFYSIWIKDAVIIPFSVSAGLLVFFCVMIISNVYMYIINGIGTVLVQLIIYVIFALVSWPLLSWSCQIFGIAGVIFSPTLAYFVLAIFGKIQSSRLIDGKARGLWAR